MFKRGILGLEINEIIRGMNLVIIIINYFFDCKYTAKKIEKYNFLYNAYYFN